VRKAMTGVGEVYHLAGLPGMWKEDRTEFHAVNYIGTEIVLAAARSRGVQRFLHCSTESILFHGVDGGDVEAEEASLSVEHMPGPYTRSKMLADRLALEAADSGMHVVVGCPTMPIGPHDHNLTPPTAMLQHFLDGGLVQMYLDFVVNMVDVRDAALGLMLALERGRVGQRYIIGGDSLPLSQVLSLMAAASPRRKFFLPVPGQLAELAATMIEFKADYLTRRQPAATVEGVRIARAAAALSIEKARRELGYAPRAIELVLKETIARMMGVPASEVLKHA